MVVYKKELNDKKILISKVKCPDGNTYYIDKFRFFAGSFYFHIGMMKTDKPLKSLKSAKDVAMVFLNGG